MMAVRVLDRGTRFDRQATRPLLRSTSLHEVELVSLRTHLGQETNDLGIPEISSWDEVRHSVRCCAYRQSHEHAHRHGHSLRGARLHLFIEKPIDCRLDGLDHLLRIVAERRLTAYVAYPLRFHPVVRELKERLVGARSCTPTWSAPRSCRIGDPTRTTAGSIPPPGNGGWRLS